MITLLLLPLFVLLAYKFYTKATSNIKEDKSIFEDNEFTTLGLMIITIVTILTALITIL
jgi:hypothetical protein